MRFCVCVAALAAAAAAAFGFLFYRWQKRERSVDFRVQTALTEAPAAPAPTPATDREEVLRKAGNRSRSLVPFRIQQGSHRGIQPSRRKFFHSYSESFFDCEKIVIVKFYHIFICNGLDSYHWWICFNHFHHPYPELCPQHYARVRSSVFITRHGHQIKKMQACVHTKLTRISLVRENVLLKKTTESHKHVVFEEDGSCSSDEYSNGQVVEVPVITPSYTGPLTNFFH